MKVGIDGLIPLLFPAKPLEFKMIPVLPLPPEKDGNKSRESAINQKLISPKRPACPDPSNNKPAGIYHGNSSRWLPGGGWMRVEKQGIEKQGKKNPWKTLGMWLWGDLNVAFRCHFHGIVPSLHPWNAVPAFPLLHGAPGNKYPWFF